MGRIAPPQCGYLRVAGGLTLHLRLHDTTGSQTGFTARRSYASAVLGVVILSVRLSVTRVLCD